MFKQWPVVLKNMAQNTQNLLTAFYYKKYFEWGFPTRSFVQVNIETNTICNRTCHFCLYGIRDEVPANPMAAGLFFKIIDQLAELRFSGRLSLFSTNEPLTDKRIYEFIRYASLMLPNSYHTLVSNGDLLNQERLDRLFSNGLDLLLINSYDDQALQRNRHWYDYALQRYPGKILHTDRTTYDDWDSRAGHIERYVKNVTQGFCDLPNYALYINPKGRVLSCCHDFDEQNLMGDLTQQTVREVWYGRQFTALRRGLNRGDRGVSDLCRGCDRPPNPDYFRWNATQPRRSGKGLRWFPRRPSLADQAEAQAIREKHLQRENRPRVSRRGAPECLPVHQQS